VEQLMTESGQHPPDPVHTGPDDAADRPGHPVQLDERRAASRDVAWRVGSAILLALLAAAWGSLCLLWLINLAILEEPEPPGVTWFALLFPGIVLFALSVARLVAPRAPVTLRILGLVYAILGTVAILSLLEAV
jgi:hypothetical protein